MTIQGIGKERFGDLNRCYDNEDELVEALKKDKVGLRNDVVRKLKKYFGL